MKMYIFWPSDQPRSTWLIHTEERERYVPDPPYDALICGLCRGFSHDQVFALGFDHISPFIRVKGDIFASDDGFLCINNRLKELIEAERFPGLALKPAGKTGWSVMNVTARFEVRPDVFQMVRGPCPDCRCPREILGAVRHLGQLITLPQTETFFSTTTDRQGSNFSDRDLLLTEAIAQAFKHNKIKGGNLEELLSEAEDTRLSQAWQRGENVKFPKGSRIVL